MNAHEALVGALNLIDGGAWVQGAAWGENDSYCLYGCVAAAAIEERESDQQTYREARDIVCEILGLEDDDVVGIGEWNDAPERTEEEVRAVLIEAISRTAPQPNPTLVYADARA